MQSDLDVHTDQLQVVALNRLTGLPILVITYHVLGRLNMSRSLPA